MTHPMLEKVARAIAAPIVRQKLASDWTLCLSPDIEALTQRIIDREWNRHVGAARAAVQALLEPDEGMVEAGEEEANRVSMVMIDRDASLMPEDYPDYDGCDLARLTFRAMLLPLIEGKGE